MSAAKRKVVLGCDGFGTDLKDAVKAHLEAKPDMYEVEDLGTDTYFDAAGKVASVVSADSTENTFGVLVCGTGMGVGMVANKYPGVRAATVENVVATRYSRAVNDANVLCLGQLVTPANVATEMTDAFFEQDFISQPPGEDGQPVSWWSEDVEKFLATSKEGIARVEKDAVKQAADKSQQ